MTISKYLDGFVLIIFLFSFINLRYSLLTFLASNSFALNLSWSLQLSAKFIYPPSSSSNPPWNALPFSQWPLEQSQFMAGPFFLTMNLVCIPLSPMWVLLLRCLLLRLVNYCIIGWSLNLPYTNMAVSVSNIYIKYIFII